MPTHPSHHDLGDDPDGTTRTRLPEGDVAVGRRPARTSSRTLVTVVGVIVLLIAALAFATKGGGRSTEGSGTAAAGPNGTAAAPTAPTGARPADGKTAGIPSGFPKSQEGAQSAAANYAVALVSADILKPATRHEIVNQLFTPDSAGALQAKLDAAYSTDFLQKLGLDANGNAPRGQTYISRTVPVGTTSSDFTGDAATVQVWCTGLFGTPGVGSTKPVTSDWFTMTLQLRWTNDWKIESFSQQSGPAPIGGDNTASSAEDITKAVEQYGGFTYAR